MQNRIATALHNFQNGMNCSQATFLAFAEKDGLNPEQARKISAGFGGGLGREGEACGAVTGAVLALGLKYGDLPKSEMYEKVEGFLAAFREKHQHLRCCDLLGVDLKTEAGQVEAAEKELSRKRCDLFVTDAIRILAQM
ncbi:C_GCAxxG_C_C family protein [bacterium]|nr:C_GCAxxG_C_C family protein [bacterium]